MGTTLLALYGLYGWSDVACAGVFSADSIVVRGRGRVCERDVAGGRGIAASDMRRVYGPCQMLLGMR